MEFFSKASVQYVDFSWLSATLCWCSSIISSMQPPWAGSALQERLTATNQRCQHQPQWADHCIKRCRLGPEEMSTIHPPLTISKEHTQVLKILFLNLRICDKAMKLLCWWGNLISVDRNKGICCTSSKQHLIRMEGKASYRSNRLSHEGGQIPNNA